MQKKICQKNEKLYIFEKPLTMPFQICKNFGKLLNNLNFNQEKLKMCKFLLTGCLQEICNFFSQNLEVGQKQRFSLLQEQAVIQAVCLRTQAVSINARF